MDYVKEKIRTIPDFPKKGIMFRDITTALKDGEAFKRIIDMLFERYKDKGIKKIVGTEARGFIIASALAYKLGIGFVPVRKKGKLPAETISEKYEKEYGPDVVEIHKDAISEGDKVLIIDDLVATGGTILATAKLVERLGGEIAEIGFLIGIPEGWKEKLKKYNVYTLINFD